MEDKMARDENGGMQEARLDPIAYWLAQVGLPLAGVSQ